MALNRTNQKRLINYHSSSQFPNDNVSLADLASVLAYGEIAVQHNAEESKLFVKTSDNTCATFIDSAKVTELINAANGDISAVAGRVTTLEGKLSGVSTTVTGYVESEIQKLDVTANTSAAVNGISVAVTETNGKVDQPVVSVTPGSIQSGDTSVVLGGAVYDAIETAKTDASADAAGQIANLNVSNNTSNAVNGISVTVNESAGKVSKPVVSVTPGAITASSVTGVAIAGDVYTAVETAKSAATTALTAFQNEVNGKLAGISGTVTGYVDDKITSAISTVYKFKGTKANYAALPATGNEVGDVWNVEAANGNTPAGTNYVWDGSAWDALGGTIDLSPYMQTSAFTEWTGGTYQDDTSWLDGRISSLEGLTSKTDSAIQSVSASESLADNKLVAVTASTTNNAVTVTSSYKLSNVSAATGTTKGLAEASDVKTYVDGKISDEVAARNTADTELSNRLGSGITTANTATAQLAAIKGNSDSALQQVVSGNTYITVGAKSGNAGAKQQTVSANVALLSAATATGKLADAKDVKDYVDGINNTLNGTINGINTRLQTVEGAYVKSVEITGSNKVGSADQTVTASIAQNKLTLDFSNFVIDCGEF